MVRLIIEQKAPIKDIIPSDLDDFFILGSEWDQYKYALKPRSWNW